MENKNDLEKFLKHKMSLDELEIHIPEISLEIQTIISSRNKQITEPESFFEKLAVFFNLQIKLYHIGIATILIAGFIFYFMNEQNTNPALIHQNASAKEASITSSTVLASLTSLADKSSVNSSTVLTSILTFVVRD